MMVEYYTDGAASMHKINGEYVRENGGCAYVKLINGVIVNQWSYGEKESTNNRMELMAILQALKDFTKTGSTFDACIIYTDSAYSLNTLTQWTKKWRANGWKKKGGEIKNLEIIKEAMTILDEYGACVSFVKVKGHSNNRWNCLVDSLAVKAKQQTGSDK